MLNSIKAAISKLPLLNEMVSERDRLHAEIAALNAELVALKDNACFLRFVPPGHFYSPIPSLEEVKRDDAKIFGKLPRDLLGLALHEQDQLQLLHQFVPYYEELPFHPQKQESLRYYYENPAYSYSDAILLHCMIRFLKPQRIIEVGSGFSSCMTLDTNELFFGGSIAITFIEPYPELLLSLVKGTDKGQIKMIPCRLQEVDLSEFEALQANDILFIDSTHVSKINSDVNRIIFDILPRLSQGVHVHFHDIFYPFEYPRSWIYEGRSWNESYILRAFLQYNSDFKILLMNTFMEHFHREFFQDKMPLCLKNTGASIWLRRE